MFNSGNILFPGDTISLNVSGIDIGSYPCLCLDLKTVFQFSVRVAAYRENFEKRVTFDIRFDLPPLIQTCF